MKKLIGKFWGPTSFRTMGKLTAALGVLAAYKATNLPDPTNVEWQNARTTLSNWFVAQSRTLPDFGSGPDAYQQAVATQTQIATDILAQIKMSTDEYRWLMSSTKKPITEPIPAPAPLVSM